MSDHHTRLRQILDQGFDVALTWADRAALRALLAERDQLRKALDAAENFIDSSMYEGKYINERHKKEWQDALAALRALLAERDAYARVVEAANAWRRWMEANQVTKQGEPHDA